MAYMTGQQVRDYIVKSGFKRADKDDELYSALTDVVREMRLEFPFQETSSDDAVIDNIASLGEYAVDVNPDFGLLISTVIMVDGNTGIPLDKISKAEYDKKYPKPTDASYRGYPSEWCLFGNQVLIGPPPDSTAYTFKMSASVDDDTVEIIPSTTAVPFSSKYRECLKYGVLKTLYAGLGEDGEAQKNEVLYERAKSKAKAREMANAGVVQSVQYQDY